MLAYKCGPAFAGLTGAVIAAYTAFTIGITQWRTRFRQAMNKADSEAGKQAMDSLINFETVKLYGNEEHELKRYDRCLAGASLLESSHMQDFISTFICCDLPLPQLTVEPCQRHNISLEPHSEC